MVSFFFEKYILNTIYANGKLIIKNAHLFPFPISLDQLIYAGTLSAPFKPELVLLSLSTGRIYHPSHFDSPGLLCSSICVELGKSIVFESENSNTGTLTYKDKQYKIGLIP